MTREVPSIARRLRRAGALTLATAAGSLALAAAAAGATSSETITSSNWSGYAAHGSAATFRNVSGRWRVPAATCVKGTQSYSSFWVGIGGYAENSTGLEQDGTELDCEADGTESVSAWYELLPAAPHTVSMTVRSGDLIAASVRLAGHRVTLSITDVTRHESFSRTISDSDVDDSSVEWIAEAPSECSSEASSSCSVLSLADFGAVRFSNAAATTTAGVTSGISTRRWTTTRLLLGEKEQSSALAALSESAVATPSALSGAGRTFTVTWSGTQTTTSTGSTAASGSSGGSGTNPGGGPSGGGAPGGGGGGSGSGGGPGGDVTGADRGNVSGARDSPLARASQRHPNARRNLR